MYVLVLPIHRYAQKNRLNRAIVLLNQGESVGHVADEVGFSSPSNFSKFFKQQTGKTPKKYQKSSSL